MAEVAVVRPHVAGLKRPPAAKLLALLALLLLLAVVTSLAIGATGLLPLSGWKVLLGYPSAADDNVALILMDIRLPRTLLAMFVGAALAISGAMMQGMFRNPLADPALVGVSSGAALAAVLVIAFGHGWAAPFVRLLGIHALPLAAFLGGLGVTTLLVAMTGGRRPLSIAGLLLAGLAIGALAQAVMGIAVYASDDRALRDLTLWTLGSFAGASWQKVFAIVPFALAATLILPSLTRGLNGLLLGEAEAFHLGIDTRRTKLAIVFTTAALVGAAVAVAGVIGFVGIVVPHVIRLIAGPDHKLLLPSSALLGATLAILADVIARVVVAPAELPVGIVMALLGAPFFLHLIVTRQSSV